MKIRTRRMGWFSTVTIVSGLVASMAGTAAAAPIAVSLASFSGSETVITFTGLGSFVPITSQYAGQGVSFSGGLYSTNNNQSQNFVNGGAGTAITIDFSSAILRVGFNVTTANVDDIRVVAFAGDTPVSSGVLNFVTGRDVSFVGLEDTDGIDHIVVSAVGTSPLHTFRMDNLRFEGTPGTPTPEPSAALLFPIGLVVAAFGARQRNGSAA